MTIRQEMLRAARRAGNLPPERRGPTARFVRSRLTAGGGFADRAGAADLYYTLFALECLTAIGAELPRGPVREYLDGFGDGEGLDLVHLGCLARCRSLIDGEVGQPLRRRVLATAEEHRAGDGGYGPAPGAQAGTVYGCFLALGLYQDVGADMPAPEGVIGCLQSLRAADGGYANDASIPVGNVPATAAAATVLRHLGAPVDPSVGDWMLARHGEGGGFAAVPLILEPDLLSTATAVHALVHMGADLDAIRASALGFVDRCRCDDGGFRGHPGDDEPDCEYTFYGLMALGHLGPGL
ncbi:MAG TPA: prenyltransferase/squalene oxidase repeat-containing protein [Phycisphaerae bacterium]|nr:prenyltransferase/squalene oxidase repeat-containing protein [Phycisphaerae bacterium]